MENETAVLDYGSRTFTIPAGRPTYEEVVRAESEVWEPLTTRKKAWGLLAHAVKAVLALSGRVSANEGQLMIAYCADWIKGQRPRNTISRRFSYDYKHVVEDMRRKQWDDPLIYTSNDAFIAAAIGLGLKYRVSGPNAYFNISEAATVRGDE